MSLISDQPTAFVFKSCPAVLLYATLNPRISADGNPKLANTIQALRACRQFTVKAAQPVC